ncbi:MAG: hypothetical protein ACP5D9_14700 [Mariniphaga sp.]|jgi:hypothetical protein
MNIKKLLTICLIISVFFSFVFIEIIPFFKHLVNSSLVRFSYYSANFFGVIVLNFLFWYMSGQIKQKAILIIPVSIAIGFITYEFLQWYIPWQIFDIHDIIASLIAMLFCLILNYFIFSFFGKQGRT